MVGGTVVSGYGREQLLTVVGGGGKEEDEGLGQCTEMGVGEKGR